METHTHDNHKNKRFGLVVFLNLSISILELIIGVLSDSLALISDAYHNFQDTITVIISYIAWIYSKKEPTVYNTYGYKRAEIIAAFVNSIFLILVSIYIIFEAIKRFFISISIKEDLMFVASVSAFLVNIISAYMLHRESKESLNWKAAYFHMIGDAMFSFSVLIAAVSIKYLKTFWFDPLVSMFIGFFILWQGFLILKKSFKILMQSSAEIDYLAIKKDIESVEGVKNIHHVHSWLGNEKDIYFEAHIELDKDILVSQSCVISSNIERILKDKYKISHLTLQFETDVCRNKDMFQKC